MRLQRVIDRPIPQRLSTFLFWYLLLEVKYLPYWELCSSHSKMIHDRSLTSFDSLRALLRRLFLEELLVGMYSISICCLFRFLMSALLGRPRFGGANNTWIPEFWSPNLNREISWMSGGERSSWKFWGIGQLSCEDHKIFEQDDSNPERKVVDLDPISETFRSRWSWWQRPFVFRWTSMKAAPPC